MTSETTRPLAGLRVLIVDDEEDNRDIFSCLLEMQGASVDVACSANEAVAFYHAARPDVIVSDIAMPERDGIWLIETLREREADGARVPAIALTGSKTDTVRDEAIRAGFDVFLAKPVPLAELAVTVARAAGR